MVDMINALTRILPLVIVKIDDPNLKDSLNKTINILNLGLGKILKICAYLGIKVERKQSAAIGEIVKNRFKKDKKDFMEYEIDELNKSLDALEKVNADDDDDDDDEEDEERKKKKIPGQIPIVVKENHTYPQKMPIQPPKEPPPIVVVDKQGIPIDKDGKQIPPKPPPAKIFWNDANGKKIRGAETKEDVK